MADGQKNKKNDFHFFWSGQSVFSQWHRSPFEDKEGQVYTTGEQYMMAQKAVLFGDGASYAKIISTHNPKLCKAIGRKVKNFDEDVWVDNRERIVYEGNFMKFSQNRVLRKTLMNTKNTCIVEASPYDKIWGIGMRETHKDATNPSKWRGLNLLGNALTKVREQLKTVKVDHVENLTQKK
jgi:ribA/ribD-fused uncharacterized protein